MTIPGEGDWTGFRNILFPVRLVPNPLESYDVVRPIVRMNGSSLMILGLTLDSDTDKMKDVMVLERSLEERLRADGAPFEVTYGHCHHYAEKILEAADEKNADLIVVPDTLDHAFREFFIGPVAQQVIHHAKVPVLCTWSQ
jgi:nucleotide-binding universal stress UspA family protein